MWQSSGGDSGGLGLDSPEGSTNPKRTVSFGERSHDSSASQASYSPRSSPKLGLSMGTFRSEHTGEQSLGTSSSALRRRGSVLAADTFTGGKPKNSTASLVKNERKYCGKVRRAINYLVLHHYTANFMGIVVLFDSFFTAFDIDARAVNESTPQIILTASEVCLVMYTLDVCLILLVYGISVMKDWMVILDTVIILCGYVELLFTRLEVAADVANGMGILRVLRMARIIRLMQLLRKTRSLKELQKLVTMMATCLKALAWSFVFCFVIMTILGCSRWRLLHSSLLFLPNETSISKLEQFGVFQSVQWRKDMGHADGRDDSSFDGRDDLCRLRGMFHCVQVSDGLSCLSCPAAFCAEGTLHRPKHTLAREVVRMITHKDLEDSPTALNRGDFPLVVRIHLVEYHYHSSSFYIAGSNPMSVSATCINTFVANSGI